MSYELSAAQWHLMEGFLPGAQAVIPPKSSRKNPWECDRALYRERHLIERAFNRLKQWRRIATELQQGTIGGACTSCQHCIWSHRSSTAADGRLARRTVLKSQSMSRANVSDPN